MVAVTTRTPVGTIRSVGKYDIELKRRLANFLYLRHVPDSEQVVLDVRGGVVSVSGQLATRHAKWLCIQCCRRVAGVIKLIDNIKVMPKRAVTRRAMGHNDHFGACGKKRDHTLELFSYWPFSRQKGREPVACARIKQALFLSNETSSPPHDGRIGKLEPPVAAASADQD